MSIARQVQLTGSNKATNRPINEKAKSIRLIREFFSAKHCDSQLKESKTYCLHQPFPAT